VKTDVVVVGGGHNGLVAAAYLAKAGLNTLVLERRDTLGGAAVTEEFHPGFRVSALAHTAGPLRPSIVRDLDLASHGLETIEPEARLFAPLPDGRALTLWSDVARSAASIRAFSARDAERFADFHRTLTRTADLLSALLDTTPPDLQAPNLRDVWPAAKLAINFRRLGRGDAQSLLRWGPMAVADFAAEWFESEPLRAVIAARGITGMLAGPWSAGTTANLLLRAAADGGHASGSATFVKGGLGALAQALASAARRAGVEVRIDAPVSQIVARDGRAAGVVLRGGEEIEARAIVSAIDPQQTFLRLLDPVLLDPEDLWRLRNYQQKGMAAKVNLALDGLPAFRGLPEGEGTAALSGHIHVGDDIDTLERAFDDAKYGGLSRRPYLDVTIPTLTDPGLAPAGKHVLSAYVQFAPYKLKSGGWDARRDELREVVLKTLEEYAPGLRARVASCQVLTPLDFERTYGLTGGHPSHGEPSLNQLFTMRPLLGFARYRTPVAGLYLCSAGTHPGDGVTGAPGANATREIAQDLR
jgi:phytoene dehydrogenase-like protein